MTVPYINTGNATVGKMDVMLSQTGAVVVDVVEVNVDDEKNRQRLHRTIQATT
jgi:hypothetical protein